MVDRIKSWWLTSTKAFVTENIKRPIDQHTSCLYLSAFAKQFAIEVTHCSSYPSFVNPHFEEGFLNNSHQSVDSYLEMEAVLWRNQSRSDGIQREEACIRALSKFTGQCGRSWSWKDKDMSVLKTQRMALQSENWFCTHSAAKTQWDCSWRVFFYIFFSFHIDNLSLPSVNPSKHMPTVYILKICCGPLNVGSECEATQVSHVHVFLD